MQDDTTTEEWRPVVGYEGYYEVSNHGRVRSFWQSSRRRSASPYLLSLKPRNQGYPYVNLRPIRTYRLVARAFLGKPPTPKHEVNHIDGNKENNHVDNLEWVTSSDNSKHAYATGLATVPALRGIEHHMAKLSENDVREIRAAKIETRSKDGITISRLAKRYEVHRKTIYDVLSRRSWHHLP